MFGTYERLGVSVWASNREVIRAALRKLAPEGRRLRRYRNGRHAFLREMLGYHAKAQDIARRWRL